MSRTERDVRIDLAAAYRLAAQRSWDDTVYTHISASVPGEPGVYLINPFGARFDEITASGLVKHAARPEIECVMHLHTGAGVALAMLPGGLLPTSQWAMRLYGRLGRHAYEGLALGAEEQARLVANLGALDGLILENHGPLMVGRTVAECWMLMYLLDRAAQAQLSAMAASGGQVSVVSDELAALTYRQWVGDDPDDATARDGAIEWPALLRGLDRTDASYRD